MTAAFVYFPYRGNSQLRNRGTDARSVRNGTTIITARAPAAAVASHRSPAVLSDQS